MNANIKTILITASSVVLAVAIITLAKWAYKKYQMQQAAKPATTTTEETGAGIDTDEDAAAEVSADLKYARN